VEDDKSAESKNKIAELKHRLNQMYAQYFSDTREGKMFESEFSLYATASEHALREKYEQLRLQHRILKTGMLMLFASAALVIFLFRESILFSTFFLLGLGFLACGFIYLMLSADIRIARAERFSSDLAHYFQQHRWNTETKQNLHLPAMPLWERYVSETDRTAYQDVRCENHALHVPFRIAISLIDLFALAVLVQSLISGGNTTGRAVAAGCFILWIAAVAAHMMLVYALVRHTERVREPLRRDNAKGPQRERPRSWIQILRIFFLLDIIFPKAPAAAQEE
jgi:hypothetical protein